MPDSALLEYHRRSKHRIDRYAPGPGRLDWANQPNPFRVYEGAAAINLPLAADALTTRYAALRRGELPVMLEFDLRSVAVLFELSLGLSAWKSFGGNRWALRCNPSSGNLHPTEGYLLCPSLPGLSAGVYHYVSRDHTLERRAAVDHPRWSAVFQNSGVVLGLASIYWREAWKYGTRAWRYCQHDCGHAIAAIGYAAAALGWETHLLATPGDDLVSALLGLDREADLGGAERETPDTLLWVGRKGTRPQLEYMREQLRDAIWSGRANHLSAEHVPWPDIDSVHSATRKAATLEPAVFRPAKLPPPRDPVLDPAFATISRQRRSAVEFDGKTPIGEESFFAMLDALLVRQNTPPWNALTVPPQVHVALLVHRVTGLEPGLYLFLREVSVLADFRASLRREWLWQKKGPEQLPLYLLLPYDLRTIAKTICCHQNIAADSCFALGMLAKVELAREEPWRYRHLFWECGMLGQALYLEAEAAGVRATGIGCYFDDEMHRLLGIEDDCWQSLYHFTVGGPIEDTRLVTLPPYSAPP